MANHHQITCYWSPVDKVLDKMFDLVGVMIDWNFLVTRCHLIRVSRSSKLCGGRGNGIKTNNDRKQSLSLKVNVQVKAAINVRILLKFN